MAHPPRARHSMQWFMQTMRPEKLVASNRIEDDRTFTVLSSAFFAGVLTLIVLAYSGLMPQAWRRDTAAVGSSSSGLLLYSPSDITLTAKETRDAPFLRVF